MKKNIIAIIPARKSSKRLKNKNSLFLGDKRLFQWSLELAKKINFFSKIVVTSDSKKILSFIKDNECIKNLRPEKFSGDNIKLTDVALYLIKIFEKKNYKVDAIALLQPTSPFRSKKIILEGIKSFYKSKGRNSVVSVSSVKKHPRVCIIKKNKTLKPYFTNHAFDKQSQELDEVLAPNGSLYISSIKNLKRNKSFFSKDTIFIKNLYNYEDIDIDEQKDLDLAKIVLNKNKKMIKDWQK